MLLCMVTIVVAIGLLSRVKLTDVYKDKSLLIYLMCHMVMDTVKSAYVWKYSWGIKTIEARNG